MVENLNPSEQKEKIQNKTVAVATTTFYKEWSKDHIGTKLNADQIRGDLAIATIKLAHEKGYQVIVVDGGSSEEFKGCLDKLGINLVNQEKKGMGASRRQTFLEASKTEGVKAICWTEPEKISMVEQLDDAVKPILEGTADIVIPARTNKSFKSYPSQQVSLEKNLNSHFNQILKHANLISPDDFGFDPSFGPRIFRNDPTILSLFFTRFQLKDGSKLTGTVRPDNYSNTTFFPIILALHQKYKVVSVPVDYIHPKSQTDFETGKTEYEQKRIDQKNDILNGATQLVRYLTNNPQKPSDLIKD